MPPETVENVYICRREPMRTDVRRRTTDGSRRQPREVGRKPAKTNYIYTSDVVSPPSSPIESEDVAGERQLVGHVEPAQDVTDDVESCRPPPSLERVNAHVPSTPSCMHMRAITHALAHVHTQAVSHTYIHTYIHTCTQLHMCAHACQNSGIRSLTYVSTHIGTYTQTYTHMRTHTTHTHMCTHTHIFGQAQELPDRSSAGDLGRHRGPRPDRVGSSDFEFPRHVCI